MFVLIHFGKCAVNRAQRRRTNWSMCLAAESNWENGKTTRSMCKTGCISCGICAKKCELFTVENNLAKLDYEKYFPSEAAETATNKCPTGVIVYRGKTAPAPRPVPRPSAPELTYAQVYEHTIAAGQTLSHISQTYGVSVSEIIRINKLKDNGNLLRVGQVINIPKID